MYAGLDKDKAGRLVLTERNREKHIKKLEAACRLLKEKGSEKDSFLEEMLPKLDKYLVKVRQENPEFYNKDVQFQALLKKYRTLRRNLR